MHPHVKPWIQRYNDPDFSFYREVMRELGDPLLAGCCAKYRRDGTLSPRVCTALLRVALDLCFTSLGDALLSGDLPHAFVVAEMIRAQYKAGDVLYRAARVRV